MLFKYFIALAFAIVGSLSIILNRKAAEKFLEIQIKKALWGKDTLIKNKKIWFWFNRFWFVGAGILLIVGALGLAFGPRNTFQCENQVTGRAGIEQAYEAVVFVRNCGATTGWSTQVSLLAEDKELTNDDTGNIFIASSGSSTLSNGIGGPYVYVGWDGKNPHLFLRYPKGVEIFRQVSNFDNIVITSSPLPDISDLDLPDSEKSQLLDAAKTYIANYSRGTMTFTLVFLKRSGDWAAFKTIPHNTSSSATDEAWLYLEKRNGKWEGVDIGTAMIDFWEKMPELDPWNTRLNQ
jgi:hypothetical protein